MMESELLAGHLQELRRGTVVLACLATLRRSHYGYGLLATLEEAGFSVDGNTLYPLLRRLEKQGLLTSEWNTDEPRPRKYYRVSPEGAALFETLLQEWRSLDEAISALREGNR